MTDTRRGGRERRGAGAQGRAGTRLKVEGDVMMAGADENPKQRAHDQRRGRGDIDAVAGGSPQRDRRSIRRRKNDLSRSVIPDREIAIFIVSFLDFHNNLINFLSAPLQRPCSQD